MVIHSNLVSPPGFNPGQDSAFTKSPSTLLKQVPLNHGVTGTKVNGFANQNYNASAHNSTKYGNGSPLKGAVAPGTTKNAVKKMNS